MSRYIPPALRKQADATAADASSQSIDAIVDHKARTAPSELARSLETLALSADANVRQPRPLLPTWSGDEIHEYYGSCNQGHVTSHEMSGNHKSGSLKSSADRPNDLVFIMIFANANREWDSERKLAVKTNLYLVKNQLEEGRRARGEPRALALKPGGPPVAVFHHAPHSPGFYLEGFFALSEAKLFKRHSKELEAMLVASGKIEPAAGLSVRSHEKRMHKLAKQWAVLQLAELERGPEVDVDDEPDVTTNTSEETQAPTHDKRTWRAADGTVLRAPPIPSHPKPATPTPAVQCDARPRYLQPDPTSTSRGSTLESWRTSPDTVQNEPAEDKEGDMMNMSTVAVVDGPATPSVLRVPPRRQPLQPPSSALTGLRSTGFAARDVRKSATAGAVDDGDVALVDGEDVAFSGHDDGDGAAVCEKDDRVAAAADGWVDPACPDQGGNIDLSHMQTRTEADGEEPDRDAESWIQVSLPPASVARPERADRPEGWKRLWVEYLNGPQ